MPHTANGPVYPHQCLLTDMWKKIVSAAMLAFKRLKSVAPEVNLGEHVTHTPPPSVIKAAHSGFETQRGHHQKSKTGYQGPHKKDLCSPIIFFKKWFVYPYMPPSACILLCPNNHVCPCVPLWQHTPFYASIYAPHTHMCPLCALVNGHIPHHTPQ